ncbi:MAG: indole-3-glycerol phosphate synthase TrpC [Henriciella sp.]|nr:indole-3-glycerol phosphate synthase TrpC [Henriciella sp.]
MANILNRIAAYKRREISAAKATILPAELDDMAEASMPPRGFIAALEQARAEGRYGLIAEIKKASPSKGIIREDFKPTSLAKAYRNGGATCLSILTDGPSFQGEDSFVRAVRKTVDLPILRKDFMLDIYQIAQARAMGADCILLIMAMLSDAQAHELEEAAISWGLDVLVEVHDEEELERAVELKTKFIGINNRNLKTFEVSLYYTEHLAPYLTDDYLVVSESGISTLADIEHLKEYNINTFLVGESLMRCEDVAEATRELLGTNQPAKEQAAQS